MHKILPIASEIRSIQHIFYTPAPDIVHEAVGHVPFLTNPLFSKFLEKYAQTVLKSITSREDLEKYEAIRDLSDLKENPKSTALQIQKQEKKLKHIIKKISYISESSYLSRVIWWTSEYGLIGSVKQPKIYGAGLISSIGEALHIHKVRKMKLNSNCLNYPFDITDFQPQLFVAQNFEQLLELLEQVSKKMAFRRGGLYGVNQAVQSQSLNTVVLDSGLQISGVLEKILQTKRKKLAFLKFSGPVQLAFQGQQLKGHGKSYHKEGYSTPLKYLVKQPKPFHLWTLNDMRKQGLKKGKKASMLFEGGLQLEGELVSYLRVQGFLLVLTFQKCLITDRQGHVFYDPSWGPFDLAVGESVSSVFSGPADPKSYQLKDDFKPSKVPQKTYTKSQKASFQIYKKIANLKTLSERKLEKLLKEIQSQETSWLMALGLLDFLKNKTLMRKRVLQSLGPISRTKIQKKRIFDFAGLFYNLD